MIGPAPAGIARINDVFRFVFYIKGEKYDKLVEVKDALEAVLQEKGITEIVQFDFDPMNTL